MVVVGQSRRDRVVVVGELDGEVLERIMTAESGADHPEVVGVRDKRCRGRMDTDKACPRLDSLQEGATCAAVGSRAVDAFTITSKPASTLGVSTVRSSVTSRTEASHALSMDANEPQWSGWLWNWAVWAAD